MRTWWERMISGRLLLGVGVARRRWCCWLLHLEAGTVPRQLSDAVIGWRWWCGRWHCSSCWTGTFAHLDLSHDSSVMNVQHHNRSIRSAQINLRRKRQKSASVFCLTSRSCTSVCIMTCLLIQLWWLILGSTRWTNSVAQPLNPPERTRPTFKIKIQQI